MRQFLYYLTDHRLLAVAGAAIVLATMAAAGLPPLALWLCAALLLGGLLAWTVRWWLRRRASARGGAGIADAIEAPGLARTDANSAEIEALRKTMREAVSRLRSSKLGMARGSAALYELPWYMVIGNPAAGKSSAILHSGLQFPLADTRVVQGVGGTRHCDWFFTSDAILLDTAGRYSVSKESHAEWLAFLRLLKRYRPRAPINGIVVAASMAEICGGTPDATIELARSLRTRMQELIEQLEVFVPVYVMFTKADLVAGFADFFAGFDPDERQRVWGATRRYRTRKDDGDVLGFFDERFDELCAGLREIGLATMAQRRDVVPAGVFGFPAELKACKGPMRAFMATLFEDNSYQFKPVFRGFYLTSACQDDGGGAPDRAALACAQRFGLALPDGQGQAREGAGGGYFLQRLFRDVIFADKGLVASYVSAGRSRMRAGAFACAALLFGLCLGGWSWSYVNNQQLLASVRADTERVAAVQQGQGDLRSRLEALAALQDAIGRLAAVRKDRPWRYGLGLYRGEDVERRLRAQYLAGVREILVAPVAASVEATLAAVKPSVEQASAEEAHNALKTYLMLADASRAETGHLNDQLARHWRTWLESNRGGMPRDQQIRAAERTLAFYLSQAGEPGWAMVEARAGLVEQARVVLRPLVRGMPAKERVYADIRARASTRHAPMTVARIVGDADQGLVLGSHAVPGAFTREAWEGFVRDAIHAAATEQTRSRDWVLDVDASADLTLEGSPEQVEKTLLRMYQAEYIAQWQKFLQGVAVKELGDFNGAVAAMNRLGDPQLSPLSRLMETVHRETSWDGLADGQAREQGGMGGWLRQRMASLRGAAAAPAAAGPIAVEFGGLTRMLAARDKDAAPMARYLEHLSRLRGRLNQLKNQGDPGPGARQFMQQTLDGSGSELSDALKFVDEQMLVGVGDAQKQVLRPLLVRPLMQTFAVVIEPAAAELNKTWQAQVLAPFNTTLAARAPFTPGAAPAQPAEIAQVFGPDGAVARFVRDSLGTLVVRRGDTVSTRTWGGLGVALLPEAVQGFPVWLANVAPAAGAMPAAAGAEPATWFQLRPASLSGAVEYTIDIDGQQLRSRGAVGWTAMQYPVDGSGVAIRALTMDGRTVEIFRDGGAQGLRRMVDAAVRTRGAGGTHVLSWSQGNTVVAVELKILPRPPSPPGLEARLVGMRLPPRVAGGAAPASIGAMP